MPPVESEVTLSAEFAAAAAHASSARAGLAMNNRLLLYGLYKQAHHGDAPTTPPAWIHVVDWSKHSAWDRHRGMPKEEAQRRYVQLVDEMLPEWRQPAAAADAESSASARRMEAADGSLDADALSAKVRSLEEQLARLTRREKRGWLFRYTPQGGSWLQPFGGSSRWERRFFVLQPQVQGELQARLVCFRGELDDLQPRRAIPLTNVVVVDEGPKKTRDRTYYVFSLYILGTLGAERGPGSGALIRLSSASSAEAMQWISCLDEASGNRGVRRLRSDADSALTDRNADGAAALGKSAEDDGVGRVLQTLGSSVSRLGSWLSQGGLRRRRADPKVAEAKERRNSGQEQEKKAKSGRRRVDPRLFPASRPMHRQRQSSLLSSAGKLGSEVELSGLINLSLIVLFSTHMHLLLDNYLKFGFLLRVPELPTGFIGRAILSLLLCCVPLLFSLLAAYVIEVSAIRRSAPRHYLADDTADVLHGINAAASILVPCALVWGGWCTSSAGGVVLLLLASILFMKLVSWAHVHRDLRLASLESEACLEAEYHGARTSAEQRIELELAKFAADVQHTEGNAHYPHNVTLINLCYFTLAPTLCYQEAFPRSKRIRTAYLVSLLGRFLLLCAFIGFACWQLILPVLRTSVEPFCKQNLTALLERLLKLALPVTYVWLAFFYAFFHVWLNVVAELLRFGDRQFYRAWWNAVTFEQYWRLWNMPVHNWISRHVYFPCLRLNLSKATCGLIAFTISAIFHELIIALPLRSLHMPLAFIAMMAQVPLVSLSAWINMKTRGTMFEQLGNYLFWVSFCFFGQPLAVLLYYNMLVLAEAPTFCQDSVAGNVAAAIAPAAHDGLLGSPAAPQHRFHLPSWIPWKL